jgi:toxin YoeB
LSDKFIIFDEQFRKDLGYWFRKDKAKALKILDLVEIITKDPFQGIGKPEPLKYIDSDTWSRRIDLEHRLIYKIHSDRIEFLQARYHY